MNQKEKSHNSDAILLVVCCIIAFFLRSYLLPDKLFFGPEQGKDFLIIRDIVYKHDFTLIGPKTDLPGIFHGPLYYYLMTIPMFFSGGDPVISSIYLILMQSCTVLIAYYCGKKLTGTSMGGIFSSVIFATSFGNVVYARWMSGQQLAIPLGFILVIFILRAIDKKPYSLFGITISLALLGQVQFINYLFGAAFFLVLFIGLFIRRLLPRFGEIIAAIVAGIGVGWGNFLLFDIRHNLLIVNSIMAVLRGEHPGSAPFFVAAKDVVPLFASWVAQFSGAPNGAGFMLTGVLCVFLISKIYAKNIKAAMIFALFIMPLCIVLAFRRGGLDQIFVIISPVVILTISWLLSQLELRKKYGGVFIVCFLVLYNIYVIYSSFPTNKEVFFQSTQPTITLVNQRKIIEEIYSSIGSQKFAIQSYTIPYFWQDGWKYLFWFYGKSEYGGNIPRETEEKILFVIIQKDKVNPKYQQDWYKNVVSTWGKLIDRKEIGEYILEKRIDVY